VSIHPVFDKAVAYDAELDRRIENALVAVAAARDEKRRVKEFLELWAYFEGLPQSLPRPAPSGKTLAKNEGDGISARNDEPQATAQTGATEVAPPYSPTGSEAVEIPAIIPEREGDDSSVLSKPFVDALLDKFVAFDPEWPDDVKSKWFDDYDRLRESHAKASTGNADNLAVRDGRESDSRAVDQVGSGDASRLSDGSGSVASSFAAVQEAMAEAIKPTRADRIRAYLADHPDAPAREIGDALGLDPKTVNKVARKAALSIRRLSPEEALEKKRLGGQIGDKPTGSPRRDKLATAHREHPDWSATEIALATGESVSYVYVTAEAMGLVLPKKKRVYAPKPDAAKFVAKPVEQPDPAPAPVAVPQSRQPAPPAAEPAFEDSYPDEAYVHPSVACLPIRKSKASFSLKDVASGLYLEQSLTVLPNGSMRLTSYADYAWRGTRDQLHAVRLKFPRTKEMKLYPVPVRVKG